MICAPEVALQEMPVTERGPQLGGGGLEIGLLASDVRTVTPAGDGSRHWLKPTPEPVSRDSWLAVRRNVVDTGISQECAELLLIARSPSYLGNVTATRACSSSRARVWATIRLEVRRPPRPRGWRGLS